MRDIKGGLIQAFGTAVPFVILGVLLHLVVHQPLLTWPILAASWVTAMVIYWNRGKGSSV